MKLKLKYVSFIDEVASFITNFTFIYGEMSVIGAEIH